MKWLTLLMLLSAMACKSPEPAASSGETSATTGTAAQTAAQAPAKPVQKPVWEIEVAGQPKLEGASIERRENPDKGQTVTFFGTPAVARVEISPDATLERVVIGFPDKVRCVFEAKTHEGMLKFELTGNRGKLEGEIQCGATAGGEKPAKIAARFAAPLNKRLKPEARDFGPGEKIKLGPDDAKNGADEE